MNGVLGKKFFERSAVTVAEDLIGKYLVVSSKHQGKKTIQKYLITETEAYEGIEDRASHASRGKTERNEVMFGEAGIFYVYFVYGMHYMLNIVTGKKEHPSAVLIRAAGEFNGPGKLTKNLKIDKKFNSEKAVRESGLWFEYCPKQKFAIKKLPRVGVNYAGPVWSKKLWRFRRSVTMIHPPKS